jgi:cellulose synthase (UDP-forming)
MATSQVRKQRLQRLTPSNGLPPQTTSFLMLGVVILAGAIVVAWFAGQGQINSIVHQMQMLGETPPLWLEVPMVAGNYLLFPTVALLLAVLWVMRVSPVPRPWSRFIVVTILLTLIFRYLLWRSLETLNLDNPLNAVFSVGLLAVELMMLTSSVIQLVLVLTVKDRHREADQLAIHVLNGHFTPSVDIFIPTYNEPAFILRRTIIGCQALEYSNKTVYLLDDTRRPDIRELAQELGCEYLTRPDNRHAKAGNLNHAIAHSSGDLIVVFDADFIPTKNFLTRTIGFFQDPQIALIQTPQSFYNPDPIAHNLGLENVLTPEEEVFYRQIQPIRDGVGSVICAGTSFVVRRSALQETGGFFTGSLSEDYFTGVRLSAKGYRLIYLDEKLSAGLAAENIAAHATQRLRWARGTLQAFFIEANPLTIRGLSPLQRVAHLEGLLHWFTSITQVALLLMPLVYSFLHVIPIRATFAELLYYFLPYYVVQIAVFSWFNHRSRSALLTNIYTLVLCFPLAWTVVQVLLKPFSTGFKVTPKGTASDRFYFNWNLAWPLLIVFVITAFSLWTNLGMCLMHGMWQPGISTEYKGINLGWIWSFYNLMLLGIALLILLDAPRPHPYEWFDLRRTVRLSVAGQAFWGITTMISEAGVEVALTQAGFPEPAADTGELINLEILEDDIHLKGHVVRTGFNDEFPTVRIMFTEMPLDQQRRLIEILFCRPGQWKRQQSPDELRSLFLLFRILLKPRILFNRSLDVSTVEVAKV